MSRAISLVISLALVLSLAPLSPAMAAGATYYVSPTGSDTAAGTVTAPLRTIQAAYNKATSGDTVMVRGGTYAERPTFAKSGTAAAPIVVTNYGTEAVTVSQGLVVSGSYNRVTGFTITPGVTTGAQISITGSNNVIDRMKQRDTYQSATRAVSVTGSYNRITNIDFSGTGALVAAAPGLYNTFSGGTIHHTGGIFAVIDQAHYTTLENLDMHDSGQKDRSGNGADGINLNAHHVTIRNNRMYNIFLWDTNQHVDAIQWWNTADDLVVEGNRFGSKAKGGSIGEGDYGHIQFETFTGKTSQRVIIRNNLFLGTHSYYNIRSSPTQVTLGSADNWQIIGNTFVDGKEIRGDVLANMRYMKIQNNIFTTTNRLQKATGSVYDNNAYVGATKNASDGLGTLQVASAGFVNGDQSVATAYGRNADFRLSSTSPLIGKGATLAALPVDHAGYSRKAPTAIGAYEYGSTASPTSPTPTPEPSVTPTPEPSITPAPVDTTPPTGWFTVNGGAKETSSNVVAVKNYITGATKYRVDTGAGYGAWTAYVASFSLTLPAGDGPKTIAIQYSDDAGNVLNQATTITVVTPVATPAPTGSMTVNAGAALTATTTVSVNSAVSGATQMRFDAGSGFGAWVPYSSAGQVILGAGDGVKTVRAEYQNAGGTLALADTITLDTAAPLGTMNVNGGATSTESTSVGVFSTVVDAIQMRIDAGNGFGAWMPYAEYAPATLTQGSGLKTICVEYLDAAGNVLSLSTTITLTSPAPAVAPTGTFSLDGGASRTYSLSVNASSNVAGATQMRFDTGAGFGAWVPYAPNHSLTLPSGTGVKSVRAEYRSAAGLTLVLSDTIEVRAKYRSVKR